MSTVTIHRNPNLVSDLEHDPKTQAAMMEIVGKFHDAVIASVPVVTGETQSEYEERSTAELVDGVASFVLRYSLWHIFEFGSIHNQPFRILTRAAESIGCTLEFGE